MQVRSADGFTQLVTHFLAHVPIAGPGNLGDPRYAAWLRRRTSDADRQTLEHDAGLLARLWAADPELEVLHGLCELHADLDGFRATTTRSLAELVAADVRDFALLERLRECSAGELVHASLSSLLEGYIPILAELEGALTLACASVRTWLEPLAIHVPELEAVAIELVFALGEHGRALPRRILVGAPAAWNQLHPSRVVMLAAHEALVRSSALVEYVAVERWALAELEQRLRSADAETRATHAAWLGSLDLRGLRAARG